MVTRNWYNYFKSMRAEQVFSNAITEWSGSKNSAGWRYNGNFDSVINFKNVAFYLSNSNNGIVVGSGRTPATIDDYKLESMITSGLSASIAKSIDSDNDTIIALTFTNTSSADITIGEIGYVGTVYIDNNFGGSKYVLLERTVLDSPVTIPAGGIGKIEYSIKLNIPEA